MKFLKFFAGIMWIISFVLIAIFAVEFYNSPFCNSGKMEKTGAIVVDYELKEKAQNSLFPVYSKEPYPIKLKFNTKNNEEVETVFSEYRFYVEKGEKIPICYMIENPENAVPMIVVISKFTNLFNYISLAIFIAIGFTVAVFVVGKSSKNKEKEIMIQGGEL